MKIISLVNSKGGVGKTTLCINLARYVQMYLCSHAHKTAKRNVVLIDADPQGSIRDWHESGGHEFIDVLALDTSASLRRIREAKLGYEYVFIDTPGKICDVMTAAIVVSDLILVPVQPSPYDLWASNDTVELINTRREFTGGQPLSRYILNRCNPATKVSKEVIAQMDTCTHGHISTYITHRTIYAESAFKGRTIYSSNNKLAMDELDNVGDEMMEILNGIQKAHTD